MFCIFKDIISLIVVGLVEFINNKVIPKNMFVSNKNLVSEREKNRWNCVQTIRFGQFRKIRALAEELPLEGIACSPDHSRDHTCSSTTAVPTSITRNAVYNVFLFFTVGTDFKEGHGDFSGVSKIVAPAGISFGKRARNPYSYLWMTCVIVVGRINCKRVNNTKRRQRPEIVVGRFATIES